MVEKRSWPPPDPVPKNISPEVGTMTDSSRNLFPFQSATKKFETGDRPHPSLTGRPISLFITQFPRSFLYLPCSVQTFDLDL